MRELLMKNILVKKRKKRKKKIMLGLKFATKSSKICYSETLSKICYAVTLQSLKHTVRGMWLWG